MSFDVIILEQKLVGRVDAKLQFVVQRRFQYWYLKLEIEIAY